jgi:hypothetical protein
MLTDDERIVLERLEEWELRIQRVLALFGAHGDILPGQAEHARDSYWNLKLDFRAASLIGESAQDEAGVTEAERRFYYPAVRAASMRLVARVEGEPKEWLSSLNDAGLEISEAIVRLQAHRERKK